MDDLLNFDIHVISGVELLLLTDAGLSSGQQLLSASPWAETSGVVVTLAVIKTSLLLDTNVPKPAAMHRTTQVTEIMLLLDNEACAIFYQSKHTHFTECSSVIRGPV